MWVLKAMVTDPHTRRVPGPPFGATQPANTALRANQILPEERAPPLGSLHGAPNQLIHCTDPRARIPEMGKRTFGKQSYVLMYVRMCVCMYVFMYACMHLCVYVCMYSFKYVMYVMYVVHLCMYVCDVMLCYVML